MLKPTMSSLRRRKPPARQPMPPAYFPAIPSPREGPAPTGPTSPTGSPSTDPGLERAYTAAYAAAFGAAVATRDGRGYVHTGGYAEPPAPVPTLVAAPQPAPRRRAALAVLVLSGLAPVAVALLVLLPLRHPGASDPVSSEANGTGATAPLASLPAGVSLPPDGSYLRTRVLASGDLHVDQWIRSRATLSRITLSVPRVPELTAGAMQASHIVVTGTRGAGQGPASVGAATQTYRLDGTHAVHLSYDVSGAVQRSSSVQGRALARVIGLDVRYASQRGPGTASVVGARVLTLACSPPRADAVPRPCGGPDTDSLSAWTVQLDGAHRDDRVMAQLDLG